MTIDIHIDRISVQGLTLSLHQRRLLQDMLRRRLVESDTLRCGDSVVDATASSIIGSIRGEITRRTSAIVLPTISNDQSRSQER